MLSFDMRVGRHAITVWSLHTASAYIQEAANNHLPGLFWNNPGSSGVNSRHLPMMNFKETLPKNAFAVLGVRTMCLTNTRRGKFLNQI